jgi:hypothetical protein
MSSSLLHLKAEQATIMHNYAGLLKRVGASDEAISTLQAKQASLQSQTKNLLEQQKQDQSLD